MNTGLGVCRRSNFVSKIELLPKLSILMLKLLRGLHLDPHAQAHAQASISLEMLLLLSRTTKNLH